MTHTAWPPWYRSYFGYATRIYRKLKLLYTVYIHVYTCIYSIPTEVYVRWVKLKTIVHRKEFQNYTVLFYDDILLDSITVKIIQKVHFARSLFIDWTTGGPTLDILMSQSNTRTSHFFKFFQIIIKSLDYKHSPCSSKWRHMK